MKLRDESGRIRIGAVVAMVLALLALAGIVLAGAVEIRSAQAYAGASIDDDLVTGTIDLDSTEADYVLPDAGHPYVICARGNRAFVTCGAAPAATTAAGGYTFSVPDGACVGPFRLTGPNCSHIATVAIGQIEFIHIDPSL